MPYSNFKLMNETIFPNQFFKYFFFFFAQKPQIAVFTFCCHICKSRANGLKGLRLQMVFIRERTDDVCVCVCAGEEEEGKRA